MTLSEQLEALDAKATAGPWTANSSIAGTPNFWEVSSEVGDITYLTLQREHLEANATLIATLRNAVPEIIAALRLAETSSSTVPPDGEPSALADRVETSADPADVAELVEALSLIAAWRKPGGPTPKKPMPSVYSVCTEAAATLSDQAQSIAELKEALQTINRKASPDPERTMSEASNDLYWVACHARAALKGGTDA